MFWKNLCFYTVFIVFWLTGCSSGIHIDVFSRYNSLEDFKTRLPEFSTTGTHVFTVDIKNYFDYYGLNFRNTRHFFGTINSTGKKIALHCYFPDKPRGSILIVHGYILHSGILTELIQYLLNLDLAVAAFDLPGHGLSGGETGDIDDFDDYARVIKDVYTVLRATCPSPYYLLGHSTGCAGIIQYLVTNNDDFQRYILAAPLIHSAYYDLSQFGRNVLGWAIKSVPASKATEISHDQEFLNFINTKDPLRVSNVPMHWVKALDEYNQRLSAITATYDTRIVIIQGDRDVVVEWEFNIEMLKRLFPNSEAYIIPDGYHELLNESAEYQNEVFRIIRQSLLQK